MTTISGEKVLLRPQRAEDAAFFANWFNDKEIMFECGFTEETTLSKELERIENRRNDKDAIWFSITTIDGKLLGETGLLRMWPEWHCTDLSIIIPDPKSQGLGYGTEVIRLMLRLAFQNYDMNLVAIGVVGQNQTALAFYQSVGFKIEGRQEQGYLWGGEYSDFVMLRILRSEWQDIVLLND